jgi:uncharacterized phiE125 gp8 family phage protein
MLIPEQSLDLDFRRLRSSIAVTTAPTVEPVSVAEAKEAARVESSAYDDRFRRWIKFAREMVEADAARALQTQTCKLYIDRFPAKEIEIHNPPVQSITSVQYVDSAGVTQTVAAGDYQTDLVAEPCLILPVFGEVWPVAKSGTLQAVIVTYMAGYASVVLCPSIAKEAILLLVKDWWEGGTVGMVGSEVKRAYDDLVMKLRWGGFAGCR